VYGASKKTGKWRNGNKMTFRRPKKTIRKERRWKIGRKKAGRKTTKSHAIQNSLEKAREFAWNVTEGHLIQTHSWEKASEMAGKFWQDKEEKCFSLGEGSTTGDVIMQYQGHDNINGCKKYRGKEPLYHSMTERHLTQENSGQNIEETVALPGGGQHNLRMLPGNIMACSTKQGRK
jgi:hypothetical protein